MKVTLNEVVQKKMEVKENLNRMEEEKYLEKDDVLKLKEENDQFDQLVKTY